VIARLIRDLTGVFCPKRFERNRPEKNAQAHGAMVVLAAMRNFRRAQIAEAQKLARDWKATRQRPISIK